MGHPGGLLDARENLHAQRRVECVGDQPRCYTEQYHQHRQRRQDRDLAASQVAFQAGRQVGRALRLLDRPEEDLARRVEHVDRAEQNAGRAEHAIPAAQHVGIERRQQHGELADEAVEPGQADARQHEQAEEERQTGICRARPPIWSRSRVW